MSWLTPIEIGLVQGLVIVGAVLSFAIAFRLLGFPDLTIEGAVPLGAGTYAMLVAQGYSPWIGLAAACAAGAACGAATAFFHVRFAVNRFLAGIIVVAIAYSLSLRVMSGPNISLLQKESLLAMIGANAGFFPGQVGLFLALVAIWATLCLLTLKFLGSRTGIQFRAVGSNARFAESMGVSPGMTTIIGLAGCNILAALSGVLQADYQGFADVSAGQGVLILALAAVAIGEAVVPKRRLSYYKFVVIAAIAGSVIYQLIVALAVRAGLPQTDLRLVTGILVLLFVALRLRTQDSAGEEGIIAR